MLDRPKGPAALTIRVLQGGSVFATGLCVSALVLQVLGIDVASRAATLGVVALIATPAISLAATAVETWAHERVTAALALLVVSMLAVATGLALLIGR